MKDDDTQSTAAAPPPAKGRVPGNSHWCIDSKGRLGMMGDDHAAPTKQNVAVIPVHGVIAHRAHMVEGMCGPGRHLGGDGLDKAIRAAVADPTIRSIVLDIDSPWRLGLRRGRARRHDLFRSRAEADRRGRERRRERRLLDRSAAHELFVIPSGEVGSIGVFGKHTDTSKADEAAGKVSTIIKAGKYKAEGERWPAHRRREGAHAGPRRRLLHPVREGVAKHRGVAVDAVRNGYGEGRSAGRQRRARGRHGRRHRDARRSHFEVRPPHDGDREPVPRLAQAQIRIAAAGWSDDSRDRTHANTLRKGFDMKSFSRKNWPLLAVVTMLVVGAACAPADTSTPPCSPPRRCWCRSA
jgi:hypothetical protein